VSPPGGTWNEQDLVEDEAVELLQKLGYTYVEPHALDGERESYREVVLARRLRAALKKLNPWLADDNLHRAARTITHVQASSLLEANEKLYTTVTYGIAVEQDRGGGKTSHTIRFIDFEDPLRNDLVVTRQFRVLGTKKEIRPDVVVFVNGLPLVVVECKSPTLGEKWKAEAIDQFHRYQEQGDQWKELGGPRLFEAAQVLVATCGQAAVYGTVGTPTRVFAEWKDP
jgi:type I restriction enzyme R subunit